MTEAEKKSRLCQSTLALHRKDLTLDVASVTGRVRVLFVDAQDGPRYGIPPTEACVRENNGEPEVCRLDCNSSSVALSQGIAFLQGTISAGTDSRTVWSTWLEPYAKLHSKIVVVDRYAVKNMAQRDSVKSGKSGLFRLLKELNSCGGQKYVTIHSGCDGSEAEELNQSVRQTLKALPAGDISEIYVYLSPDYVFKREAHYRYIHFGADTCFILDTGLEVLEGDSVFRNSPFHFADADPKLIGCEARLRQHRDTKRAYLSRGAGLRAFPASVRPATTAG